jgi:hypothetical protein
MDSVCGNNLAQEWHFSVEMFKRFLAAMQRCGGFAPASGRINPLFISLSP